MTLKQYRQVEDAGKGEAMATTHVGQVAKIEQKEGRTTADARTTTSQAPVSKPTGKPMTVTSADQLQVGMKLRLRDQGISGIVEVIRVYPANFKSLDEIEASVYLEGVQSHNWSGLYFDQHLKDYRAVIIEG